MTNEQAAVRRFHEAIHAYIGDRPSIPPASVRELRKRLIREEFHEFVEASDACDIVEVADALGDLLVVVYGAAVTYGIDLEPIFAEIHRTNMLKEGGPVDAGGKALKPEGWQPPELGPIIMAQFDSLSEPAPYLEARDG